MSAITSDIPANPHERALWVRYQLALRDTSMADIARRLNVTKQCVSLALRAPSTRVEQAIAEALGLDVAQLFPERFDPAGERRRGIGQSTGQAGRGKVKTRAPAGQRTAASRSLRG